MPPTVQEQPLSDYARRVRDALHSPAPASPRMDDDSLYEECMKARDVARWLDVNRKTVYEYAARRVIPCRRLGRRVIFGRQAIAMWLARALVPNAAKHR